MSLEDCKICGKTVRAGARKISAGPGGVYNFIVHTDGSTMHGDMWDCFAFKPYHKKDEFKPFTKLIDRWNAENVVEKSDA